MPRSTRCSSSGCRNRTLDPTGLCYQHVAGTAAATHRPPTLSSPPLSAVVEPKEESVYSAVAEEIAERRMSPGCNPGWQHLTKAATAGLDEGSYTGRSKYKVIGMAFSARITDDGRSMEDLTTLRSLTEVDDIEPYVEALYGSLDHPGARDPEACLGNVALWTRFGLSADKVKEWSGRSNQIPDSTGLGLPADAYLAERAGCDSALYVEVVRNFASHSQYGTTLARKHVDGCGAIRRACIEAGTEPGPSEVIKWYRDDWDPSAAARMRAAGATPELARRVWNMHSTNRGLPEGLAGRDVVDVVVQVADGSLPIEWAEQYAESQKGGSGVDGNGVPF